MKHVVTLMAVLIGAPSLRAQDQDPQEVFDGLFGADVKRALATPDSKDDLELASVLVKAVQGAELDADLLAIVCNQAATLAAGDAGGFDLALEALSLLGERVPGKQLEVLARTAEVRQRQYVSARGADRTAAAVTLVETLLELGEAQLAAGQAVDAVTTCRRASSIAAAVRWEGRDQIRGLLEAAVDAQRLERQINEAKLRLAANPKDKDAGADLVRLLVVERDAPAEARKYTFLLEDEAARQNVSWAAGDVDQLEADQALALGGWYQSLVEQAAGTRAQAAMMRRSISAFDRYLESDAAEGLGKTRATLVRKSLGDRLAALEEKSGPASARPSTGRWVDVLALVKPELHTQKPSSPGWEKREGVLHSTGKIATIGLPVVLASSYELEMKFRRGASDRYVLLQFPAGDRSVSLVLSSSLSYLPSGMGLVDGMGVNVERNPTRLDWATEEGKPYAVALKVVVRGEEAAIRVAINGQTRIQWSGPREQLRPRWPNNVGHNLVLTAYFCPLEVSAIRVRPTDGNKLKPWEGPSREERSKKPDRPGEARPDAVVAERVEMIRRMWERLGEPQRREVLEWLRNSDDPRARKLYKDLRR